ncbi:hypothetical protein F5J12DRAFT_895777 [Pisolithus orientalis]|uniref:uncharacterized protein n=1 Tax=Pisolithus orientalis TaxID=936130 RepID=UPI0022249034|nr:uncharacterized protein F5J12DRAFT_895777 [Pisolithus orientalis]KAI5997648.1 hypothetical protein F5J12DRAFT_895777 [Pisolithus orientalis]
MPTTAKPVSPFFGHDSTVPPPLPSMLTDQIELFGSPCCHMTLLADEVLAPAGLDTRQVIKSEELPNSYESKIPKPIGEPGHPGHGEYTLEIALDWNHKIYVKFKKHIFHPINEHLDITKCASVQNPTLLRLVCNKAVAVFPDLDNYAHAWPVSDMIMMHLKYTSSCARCQEVEMAALQPPRPRSAQGHLVMSQGYADF